MFGLCADITDRHQPNCSNRRQNSANDREFYGRRQGTAEGNNPGQLYPNAQDFNTHVETTPVNLDRNGRSERNEARALN